MGRLTDDQKVVLSELFGVVAANGSPGMLDRLRSSGVVDALDSAGDLGSEVATTGKIDPLVDGGYVGALTVDPVSPAVNAWWFLVGSGPESWTLSVQGVSKIYRVALV